MPMKLLLLLKVKEPHLNTLFGFEMFPNLNCAHAENEEYKFQLSHSISIFGVRICSSISLFPKTTIYCKLNSYLPLPLLQLF